MVRYKEFASKAAAEEQAAAIDKELGLPRRGTNRGKGPHAPVPAVYAPGAIGWTATECALDVDAATGTALLTLTEAALALGRRNVTVDGRVVALDMTRDVLTERPSKYVRPVPGGV